MQTKMSLATAGIYCTISPPLSGAMEDCSTVRVQHLHANALAEALVLCVRVTTHVRLAMERSRRSRASATRRQVRWRNAKQRPMYERGNPGVPVASVADGALCDHNTRFTCFPTTIFMWSGLNCGLAICDTKRMGVELQAMVYTAYR